MTGRVHRILNVDTGNCHSITRNRPAMITLVLGLSRFHLKLPIKRLAIVIISNCNNMNIGKGEGYLNLCAALTTGSDGLEGKRGLFRQQSYPIPIDVIIGLTKNQQIGRSNFDWTGTLGPKHEPSLK